MRNFLFPVLIAVAATVPHVAGAQEPGFYNCQNDRLRVAIAPMPLDKALARFTDTTRCPVSLDTDRVKGRPTRSMKTAAVKGRFTPEQALARMLRGTPLKARMNHGGFSVSK